MLGKSSLDRLAEAVAGAERQHEQHHRAPPSPSSPWTIAISREAGANGTGIARLVGEQLGWPVYDRELLERIAHDMGLHTRLVESLDEKHVSWLGETLAGLSSAPTLSGGRYMRHLVGTVLSLAARGNCILVGRGAPQILPAGTTLRVRLVAPLEARITTIGQKRSLSREKAQQYIERTDQERSGFVSEHFHKDPADPKQYDLILNSARYSAEGCAELIIEALRQLRSATCGTAAVQRDVAQAAS
jgi:cytidylate kinase